MRIKSLAAQPDRVGRHTVGFEDGSILRLYRQTIEDFGLYAGLELTERQLELLKEAAGQMSAKMRAVRIVAASSVSEKDLQQRLVQKGEDPDNARQAVEWMVQLELVDDRKTAEQTVQRCISKGYGLARARQALYEKRIPREYWDGVLEDYPEQLDAITAYLRDKRTDPKDPRQLRKAVDALMRKGHSYRQIRKAMLQLDPEADLQEEF